MKGKLQEWIINPRYTLIDLIEIGIIVAAICLRNPYLAFCVSVGHIIAEVTFPNTNWLLCGGLTTLWVIPAIAFQKFNIIFFFVVIYILGFLIKWREE